MGESIYYNKTPLKFLFISELIIGIVIITVFVYFIVNEFFLDIWTFAGPLLGLAFMISGFTTSKIKRISINRISNQVVIYKESIFNKNTEEINLDNLTVELKTANGKKNRIFPKLKLNLLENDKEIEKLESSFFSINNSKKKRIKH